MLNWIWCSSLLPGIPCFRVFWYWVIVLATTGRIALLLIFVSISFHFGMTWWLFPSVPRIIFSSVIRGFVIFICPADYFQVMYSVTYPIWFCGSIHHATNGPSVIYHTRLFGIFLPLFMVTLRAKGFIPATCGGHWCTYIIIVHWKERGTVHLIVYPYFVLTTKFILHFHEIVLGSSLDSTDIYKIT